MTPAEELAHYREIGRNLWTGIPMGTELPPGILYRNVLDDRPIRSQGATVGTQAWWLDLRDTVTMLWAEDYARMLWGHVVWNEPGLYAPEWSASDGRVYLCGADGGTIMGATKAAAVVATILDKLDKPKPSTHWRSRGVHMSWCDEPAEYARSESRFSTPDYIKAHTESDIIEMLRRWPLKTGRLKPIMPDNAVIDGDTIRFVFTVPFDPTPTPPPTDYSTATAHQPRTLWTADGRRVPDYEFDAALEAAYVANGASPCAGQVWHCESLADRLADGRGVRIHVSDGSPLPEWVKSAYSLLMWDPRIGIPRGPA